MEDQYNHLSENTARPRGSFLYAGGGSSGGGPVLAPNDSSVYGRSTSSGSNQQTQMLMHTAFHLQSDHHECFPSHEAHPVHIKTEANTSQPQSQQHHVQKFHYPLINRGHHILHHQQHQHQEGSNEVESIKAKIIAHPHYSNLLQAYMDCQKVGAPPEVVARLAAVRQEFETRQRSSMSCRETSTKDPELDRFMEAYYDMLVKYREELTRPLQEAMDFMQRIETQLNTLSNGASARIFNSGTLF